MKFQKQYSMGVEQYHASTAISTLGKEIVVSDPKSYLQIPSNLTVEFDIKRSSLSEGGTATFKIYNLSETSRTSIFKDYFNGQDVRGMFFRAGYQGQPLAQLFLGQISECNSFRAGGDTNNITQLNCIDANWDRTWQQCTTLDEQGNLKPLPPFPAGTTNGEMIRSLAKLFPNITNTVIGPSFFNYKCSTPWTVTGLAWNQIYTLSNGKAFTDLGTLYCLADNEIFSQTIFLDEKTILGTPKRSGAIIEVEMLMDPRVHNGMCVNIPASVSKIFAGNWKICQISHSGTISPTVDAPCKTKLLLWKGEGISPSVQGAITGTVAKPEFLPFIPTQGQK